MREGHRARRSGQSTANLVINRQRGSKAGSGRQAETYQKDCGHKKTDVICKFERSLGKSVSLVEAEADESGRARRTQAGIIARVGLRNAVSLDDIKKELGNIVPRVEEQTRCRRSPCHRVRHRWLGEMGSRCGSARRYECATLLDLDCGASLLAPGGQEGLLPGQGSWLCQQVPCPT